MSNTKFTLERYKPGGGNRYTCPGCGKHKCFTRYVNTETGEYLDDACGKCNHELSCGYHYKPKEYFAEHSERSERETFIKRDFMVKKEVAKTVRKTIGTIDASYVEKSHSGASTFVKWMERTFCRPEDLQRVYEDYMLGATRDGGVIYWQIDKDGKVRTGKVMHYWMNGHRVADEEDFARYRNMPFDVHSPSPTYFVHPRLLRDGVLPKDWRLVQCLFGEHLLARRKDDVVCLVESEKSAVVCALFYPQYVWVATCGSKGLSVEKLVSLKGRRVVVFPDSGEQEAWRLVMSQTEGIDYSLCDRLETYPHNTDIADVILIENAQTDEVHEQEREAVRVESEGVDECADDGFEDDIFSVNTEECPF